MKKLLAITLIMFLTFSGLGQNIANQISKDIQKLPKSISLKALENNYGSPDSIYNSFMDLIASPKLIALRFEYHYFKDGISFHFNEKLEDNKDKYKISKIVIDTNSTIVFSGITIGCDSSLVIEKFGVPTVINEDRTSYDYLTNNHLSFEFDKTGKLERFTISFYGRPIISDDSQQ